MTYYGRFYRSQLYPFLQRINTYLMRWARQEVQTAAVLQALHGVVDRISIEPRAVRALALGPHVRRTR